MRRMEIGVGCGRYVGKCACSVCNMWERCVYYMCMVCHPELPPAAIPTSLAILNILPYCHPELVSGSHREVERREKAAKKGDAEINSA